MLNHLICVGCRVSLISFGFEHWFLGLCIIYIVSGCYLTYTIVDERMPLDDDTHDSNTILSENKHPMRFFEFVNRDAFQPNHDVIYTPPIQFLATLQRSSITISEFVLLIL